MSEQHDKTRARAEVLISYLMLNGFPVSAQVIRDLIAENERLKAAIAQVEQRTPQPSLQWDDCPEKTQYGAGMMEAFVELSKNETMTLVAHRAAIGLVPAALARLAAPVVPDGWRLYSADASIIGKCSVLLTLDPVGTKRWHAMSQEQKDLENGPALFVTGQGVDFHSAFADACRAATFAAAPTVAAKGVDRG